MSERALVLLSGGIDSAVALYWAISRGWQALTIEFDYHLRPPPERRAAELIRAAAGIGDSVVVPAGFLRESGDLPAGMSANPGLAVAPEGYFPSRNLIFYSIAAYYAEICNVRRIVGGHNRTDCESFPDAGAGFFALFNDILAAGMWSHREIRTEVVLPLIELGKRDVIDLGRELSVPFGLTWSCYFDGERPCGSCASCVERTAAFSELGISDPLL